MRRAATTVAIASSVVMAGYFQATAAEEDAFASTEARESYAMGSLIGQQIGKDAPELDATSFLEGMGAALGQGEARLTEQEIAETLEAYEARQMAAAKQRSSGRSPRALAPSR